MKISPKQLAQTLYDLTDGKSKSDIEKTVADFAAYLKNSRKLKMADKITHQFAAIWNQKNGIVEATIVSRKKMSEAELAKVKKYVKEKYAAKEVELINTVDEKIGGGFVLRVGDEVADGSVRGKLGELRKVLSN
jgi:F-type H+-transporting ATPase subunit delta